MTFSKKYWRIAFNKNISFRSPMSGKALLRAKLFWRLPVGMLLSSVPVLHTVTVWVLASLQTRVRIRGASWQPPPLATTRWQPLIHHTLTTKAAYWWHGRHALRNQRIQKPFQKRSRSGALSVSLQVRRRHEIVFTWTSLNTHHCMGWWPLCFHRPQVTHNSSAVELVKSSRLLASRACLCDSVKLRRERASVFEFFVLYAGGM